MVFSRQENWSGLPFPPPGDLPNSEIRPSDRTSVSYVLCLYWQACSLSRAPPKKPNTRDKQIRDEHSGKQSNTSSKNSTQCYYMTQRSHSQVHTQNNTNRYSTNTCTHMFITALLTASKTQNQSKSPSVEEQINCGIHIRWMLFSHKKDRYMLQCGWTLKPVKSKKPETKFTYCMIPTVRNMQNR